VFREKGAEVYTDISASESISPPARRAKKNLEAKPKDIIHLRVDGWNHCIDTQNAAAYPAGPLFR
jgi:hypothetical protein